MRKFLPFAPAGSESNTKAVKGCPGQHFDKYFVPLDTDRLDYLEAFLQSRTSREELDECNLVSNINYRLDMMEWGTDPASAFQEGRKRPLWTHGYDLYVPTLDPVTHNYSHATQDFWVID